MGALRRCGEKIMGIEKGTWVRGALKNGSQTRTRADGEGISSGRLRGLKQLKMDRFGRRGVNI